MYEYTHAYRQTCDVGAEFMTFSVTSSSWIMCDPLVVNSTPPVVVWCHALVVI